MTKNSLLRRLAPALVLATAALAGCGDPPEYFRPDSYVVNRAIHPGDVVSILQTNEHRIQMTVTKVTPDALVGTVDDKETEVAYGDMQSLKMAPK